VQKLVHFTEVRYVGFVSLFLGCEEQLVHPLTGKTIIPMGGFPHYGEVSSDCMMLKVCIMHPKCTGCRRYLIAERYEVLTAVKMKML
jgi:hypothetical protein